MRALIVLTHSESKRLIARGIKKLPEVEDALKNHKIFIARGSTTAYVLEELLEERIEKNLYVAGQMTGEKKDLYRFGSLKSEKRLKEVIIEKGVKREIEDLRKELQNFEPGDLIIKGGNTLGVDGIAGVYMADTEGGTIGAILPIALSRGVQILVPISLSRRIEDSVWELSKILGNQAIEEDYTMGLPIGLMPIPGEVFTELEAFDLLYPEVNVFQIGASGVGSGEGSLHFLLAGEENKVKKAYEDLVKLVKQEEEYVPITD
ncbi:MAG: hypothetical protein ACTSUR_06590 [Candidatus Heimdallarchaeaceae archaeon]